MRKQEDFINQIKDNEGIIHKVISLYVYREEDKKDMYQEVLMQAWKSYNNFKGQSKFSTWLYKVSLNTALTYKRKFTSFDKLSDEIINKPDELEDKSEYHEVLHRLIRQFDEIDRMLVMLHLDGYKNTEISEITGMKTNHVNVKIHRLKLKIVEQFKNATNGNI